MRAVTGISATEATPPGRPGLAQVGAQAPKQAAAPQPGRAVVLMGLGAAGTIDPQGSRPSAVFLAQLIATAQQAPQTRGRRRAEPTEVTTVYTAVSTPAVHIGQAIYRWL